MPKKKKTKCNTECKEAKRALSFFYKKYQPKKKKKKARQQPARIAYIPPPSFQHQVIAPIRHNIDDQIYEMLYKQNENKPPSFLRVVAGSLANYALGKALDYGIPALGRFLVNSQPVRDLLGRFNLNWRPPSPPPEPIPSAPSPPPEEPPREPREQPKEEPPILISSTGSSFRPTTQPLGGPTRVNIRAGIPVDRPVGAPIRPIPTQPKTITVPAETWQQTLNRRLREQARSSESQLRAIERQRDEDLGNIDVTSQIIRRGDILGRMNQLTQKLQKLHDTTESLFTAPSLATHPELFQTTDEQRQWLEEHGIPLDKEGPLTPEAEEDFITPPSSPRRLQIAEPLSAPPLRPPRIPEMPNLTPKPPKPPVIIGQTSALGLPVTIVDTQQSFTLHDRPLPEPKPKKEAKRAVTPPPRTIEHAPYLPGETELEYHRRIAGITKDEQLPKEVFQSGVVMREGIKPLEPIRSRIEKAKDTRKLKREVKQAQDKWEGDLKQDLQDEKDWMTKQNNQNMTSHFGKTWTDFRLRYNPQERSDIKKLKEDFKQSEDFRAWVKQKFITFHGNRPKTPTTGAGELIKKGIYDNQIDKVMSNNPKYLGTVPSDKLKDLLPQIKPGSSGGAVVNLDKASQRGSHWVGIHYDPYSVEYFDSFGRNPPPIIYQQLKNIAKIVSPNNYAKLKINKVVDQDKKSSSCGYLSMLFLKDRFAGKSFKEATHYPSIEKAEDRASKLKKHVGFGYI